MFFPNPILLSELTNAEPLPYISIILFPYKDDDSIGVKSNWYSVFFNKSSDDE